MVTNFKIFESSYRYLSDKDEEIFKEYITPIIYDYFEKKIPKLKLGGFLSSNFNYHVVVDDSIFDIFFFRNMYRHVRNNISNVGTPAVHNSFTKILNNIISDNVAGGDKPNVLMKLENRLIEIFEKDPETYKKYYDWYGDDFSATLKDKLEYILNSEKYNL